MRPSILFVAVIFMQVSCKNNGTSHIDSFHEDSLKIVTSDIENFWSAYDRLSSSSDSVEIFQKYYLDKASPEFQEFLKLRNFTAEEYVESIKKFPSFWKSVRPMTEKIELRKKELIPFFNKMKKLYPLFKQPDVCFAIGTIRTGGTVSEGLILIGAEIAAADSTIDKSEFDDGNFMKAVLGKTGDIMGIVAHETIHTQQPEDDENTSLLEQAISEGAADFLATLLLGKRTMSVATFEYGAKHEESLWKEFYIDVREGKSSGDTDWFYDYRSNRPADLGYFIGYKITESYYNHAKDKKKAIKDIIEIENPVDFLEKSKYKEKYGC